jgi:hypothetical protein
VEDGKVVSQRHVRPGFAYGHWANGRNGCAITGNGDKNWVDYEVAFDYKMLPANREFFHAYIPGETRGMTVIFRTKNASESWNEPSTHYNFGLSPKGGWGVSVVEDYQMPGYGFCPPEKRKGKYEKLAEGAASDYKDTSEGRFRIRVQGSKFTVWFNDEKLVEHTPKSAEIDPIPYGGFGVQWRYESMGWISNVAVKKL